MSLGFEQAGFDVIAAVELDPIHAAVHHFNFPYATTLASSVVGLDAHSIAERLGNANGMDGMDVVCGGAPCQGFSLIWQRILDDPRNLLVKQFVRLVVDLHFAPSLPRNPTWSSGAYLALFQTVAIRSEQHPTSRH